ncbi:MAG: histidine phosphatase family protein [Proteobacteria bacterium]|nr:histidine phosphatase family protein [Pseudomonadota bacterium]
MPITDVSLQNFITIFYLYRHGETDDNAAGKFQGQSVNRPLNTTGKFQILEIKKKLNRIHVDLAVTSPMIRADEMANGVHENVPIIQDFGLVETSFRLAEGQKKSDLDYIPNSGGGLAAHYDFGNESFCWQYGESHKTAFDRIANVLLRLVCQYPGKTIAISTHGNLLANLIAGLSCDKRGVTLPKNGEIFICIAANYDYLPYLLSIKKLKDYPR